MFSNLVLKNLQRASKRNVKNGPDIEKLVSFQTKILFLDIRQNFYGIYLDIKLKFHFKIPQPHYKIPTNNYK